MDPAEAKAARLTLGLTRDQLAAEFHLNPAVVDAWEEGRIGMPKRLAADLRWRAARMEREQALVASGLPECQWLARLESAPRPRNAKEHNAQLQRIIEHVHECSVCRAREAFIAERFPPMPPPPRSAWVALLIAIRARIRTLPEWAQPVAVGAIIFVIRSLLRVLFLLPAIAQAPAAGIPNALEVLGVSAALGAAIGFLYGQFRAFRKRWASRGPPG